MIVLGVDPGTLVTGYGVIEVDEKQSSKFVVVEYGTVESKKIATLPKRLEAIFNRLTAVIERTTPDEFAIESAFYDKNIQSTLKLGHARGVAILCAVLKQIPTAEYSPREIKRAVVGNGNAAKPQVEYMVRQMLQLPNEDLRLPDAYDALAVAITHALRHKSVSTGTSGKGKANSWKQFVDQHPSRVKKTK